MLTRRALTPCRRLELAERKDPDERDSPLLDHESRLAAPEQHTVPRMECARPVLKDVPGAGPLGGGGPELRTEPADLPEISPRRRARGEEHARAGGRVDVEPVEGLVGQCIPEIGRLHAEPRRAW